MNDYTTIFWSPASFIASQESWNYLYREPENANDINDNVFVVKSNINDTFKITFDDILASQKNSGIIDVVSKLPIFSLGQSVIKDHWSIGYNLNWIMFSDQPITIKSFLPEEHCPVKNSKFKEQILNIGQLYLPVGLTYDVPTDLNNFSIIPDEPLMFFQIDSKKPVVFKRFIQTDVLFYLMQEFLNIKNRYGKELSDKEMIEGILNSKMPAMTLNQIRKNLISD
jgi:hypothetical protein